MPVMRPYRSTLRILLDKVPGKRTFGIYRFLPLFFAMGAAVEYSMIKWTVGQTNFCKYFFVSSAPQCQKVLFRRL